MDFHALRHTCITLLAVDPTVPLKAVQSLARHSTPALTFGRNAKVRDHSVEAAILTVDGLGKPAAGGTYPPPESGRPAGASGDPS